LIDLKKDENNRKSKYERDIRLFPDLKNQLSANRFNEYIPSKPLIGLGFFSCFELNRSLNRR